MSVQYTDGAGRHGVIGHPAEYDRPVARARSGVRHNGSPQGTRPTEVTQAWIPTGEDAAGWVVTTQTYDWQGRPTETVNQDGSTRELSYSGCGCAGGDVVTIRDERGRRRKLFNDTLERMVKVEELNWDQSVYSTTLYALQRTRSGNSVESSGPIAYVPYDNHGRLQTRTTPEQGATTYGYNSDDTVQTLTDARNAVMTFSYNPRKLVTGISFHSSLGCSNNAERNSWL